MEKVVEFEKKTMFPKKHLDMEFMYSYLLKSAAKYSDRTVDEVKGVYRSLQDSISFAKEGGRVPISEESAALFKKQGYLLESRLLLNIKLLLLPTSTIFISSSLLILISFGIYYGRKLTQYL